MTDCWSWVAISIPALGDRRRIRFGDAQDVTHGEHERSKQNVGNGNL